MPILYFLFVKTAELLLPVIAFVSKNKKITLFTEGRKNLFANLSLPYHPKRFWFHCASLGEFEQARPVIEKLKHLDSETSIVISFFSPSGYEQKKHYDLADTVIYLPLDTPSNARKLVRAIQPTVVVFIKYEIWYFHLKELFSKNIPAYLISAHFRSGQGIFTIWGKWLFRLLPQYKQIFLQNKTSFELLKNKDLNNITLSGDTRYDRVLQNAENVKKNETIAGFKGNGQLLILGSSWPAEEDILLQYLDSKPDYKTATTGSLKDRYKIIIAPHDINDKHISEIREKFRNYLPELYTEFNHFTSSGNLIILNTIGHLASAYYYADVAFIGGGFTGQLHNILEPMAFGVPLITGPVHEKFPEAGMAKAEGLLFETTDGTTFAQILDTYRQNSLKEKTKTFVRHHTGATDIVIKKILEDV